MAWAVTARTIALIGKYDVHALLALASGTRRCRVSPTLAGAAATLSASVGGVVPGVQAPAEGPVASWQAPSTSAAPRVSRFTKLLLCHIPTLSRTCTLRGRPSDAPLKKGPLSAYLLSNRL